MSEFLKTEIHIHVKRKQETAVFFYLVEGKICVHVTIIIHDCDVTQDVNLSQ